jgi:hypothetical protein
VLYSLAATPATYAAEFHDITSGTNACVAGAPNCVAADESSYAAAAGYDQATGLGSIDFNALTAAWPAGSYASLLKTAILIIPSATEAMAGQTVSLQILVSTLSTLTGTPIPTGGVSVSVDGTVVDASLAFSTTNAYNSQASVDYNLVAPSTAGSHLLAVTYPGDAAHSPSTAIYSVLVGNVLASGGISLSVGNLTIANGNSGSTQVTVTPTGGYNGRLAWSLAVTSKSSANLTGCYGIASLPVNSVSTTTLTIGVGAACSSASPSYRGEFQTLSHRALASGDMQGHRRSVPATAVYASLLLCGCFAGRRWKWRSPLLLVILLLPVAGANLIGCGGGGGNNTSTSTTTPSTPSPSTTSYSVTLTGTDSVNGLITASTTFTLTVN